MKFLQRTPPPALAPPVRDRLAEGQERGSLYCCLFFLMCLAAPLLGQTSASHPLPHSAVLEQPLLVFDAETKRYDAAPGEADAPFTFNLTNTWTNEVVIHRVQASCGCTTVDLPPIPWHLAPGGAGQVHAKMNLMAKMGLVTKELKFFLSAGTNNFTETVNIVANIPPPPALAGSLSERERQAAMSKARLEPQAIFKGDCAACHAAKGQNLFGEDLYAADCGICHESAHRASVVPDLHALTQPTDLEYWKTLITFGKPHSLMPAFAQSQGGPLTEAQIASLALYLNHTISHHLSPPVTNTASASPARWSFGRRSEAALVNDKGERIDEKTAAGAFFRLESQGTGPRFRYGRQAKEEKISPHVGGRPGF